MSGFSLRITLVSVFLLASMAPYAHATLVQWTISSSTFDDGGTLSGTFVFDTVAITYSSINLTTTAGSAFGGANYTSPLTIFSANSFHAGPSAAPSRLSLSNFIGGGWATPGVISGFGFGERACLNAGCTSVGSSLRAGASSNATGVVIPEPGTAVLLLAGLGCLFALRRRGRLSA